jgi:hypothetical protein
MKKTVILLTAIFSLSTMANIACKSTGVADFPTRNVMNQKVQKAELNVSGSEIYFSYSAGMFGLTVGYDDKAAEGVFYKVQRGYCSFLSCLGSKSINGYNVIVVDDSQSNVVVSEIYIPSVGKKLGKKDIVKAINDGVYQLWAEVELTNCN